MVREVEEHPESILAQNRLEWTNVLPTQALQWRHNGHDSVSNHQPHDCLLGRLFRRRSKKTSKLRVTGFCAGNSPGTGEFPTQRAGNAENFSIWWRHHGYNDHNYILSAVQLGSWYIETWTKCPPFCRWRVFKNAFSWMKKIAFLFYFHWRLIRRAQASLDHNELTNLGQYVVIH